MARLFCSLLKQRVTMNEMQTTFSVNTTEHPGSVMSCMMQVKYMQLWGAVMGQSQYMMPLRGALCLR